ncbi:MAG: hypothetical protein HY552_02365 [Elusimicrobia bacterium]|nr:hypothetical protein [Elusimicrobiota bacterium]
MPCRRPIPPLGAARLVLAASLSLFSGPEARAFSDALRPSEPASAAESLLPIVMPFYDVGSAAEAFSADWMLTAGTVMSAATFLPAPAALTPAIAAVGASMRRGRRQRAAPGEISAVIETTRRMARQAGALTRAAADSRGDADRLSAEAGEPFAGGPTGGQTAQTVSEGSGATGRPQAPGLVKPAARTARKDRLPEPRLSEDPSFETLIDSLAQQEHIFGGDVITSEIVLRAHRRLGWSGPETKRIMEKARERGELAVLGPGQDMQAVDAARQDPKVAEAVRRFNRGDLRELMDAAAVFDEALAAARQRGEAAEVPVTDALAFLRGRASLKLGHRLAAQAHRRERSRLRGQAAADAAAQLRHLADVQAGFLYNDGRPRQALPLADAGLLLTAMDGARRDGSSHRGLDVLKRFLDYQAILNERERTLEPGTALPAELKSRADALGAAGTVHERARLKDASLDDSPNSSDVARLIAAGRLARLDENGGSYLYSKPPDQPRALGQQIREATRLIDANASSSADDGGTLIQPLAGSVLRFSKARAAAAPAQAWEFDGIYRNLLIAFADQVRKQERFNVEQLGTPRERAQFARADYAERPAYSLDRGWINAERRPRFQDAALQAVRAYRARISGWDDVPRPDVFAALGVLEEFLETADPARSDSSP